MPDSAHNSGGQVGRQLLLNAVDAAKLLGIRRKTLWNNTAPRGDKIPAVRVGQRLVRYRPADLERWVNDQESEG